MFLGGIFRVYWWFPSYICWTSLEEPGLSTRTFQMIAVSEAESIIRGTLVPCATESVSLIASHGRILRESIFADRDQPPFNRVTMDGIAFDSARVLGGQRRFRVAGVQAAGAEPLSLSDGDTCFEVMTGAVLPTGSNAVVRIEDIMLADGWATIDESVRAAEWQNVHRTGSDHARGTELLRAGCVLRSPEIAVAASVGKSTLLVARPPRVAVVSTGDELVDVGDSPLPHQIRRSNSYAIQAALFRIGVTQVTPMHVRDERDTMESAIASLLDEHDLLILAGGVSMGRFDYVPDVLAAVGVDCQFHGVRQRPGKPMWFGVGRRQQPVFALPGNPVSTLVCLHRYVLPAIAASLGAPDDEAILIVTNSEHVFKPRLTLFLPVSVVSRADGVLSARLNPTNGSGDYGGLAGTTGFIELDEQTEYFPSGTVARHWNWF